MSVTHVVSFSGGRTSAYLVHLMEQRRMAYANAYNAETVKIRDSLAQGVSA